MLTRRHMEVATGLLLAFLGAVTAYGSTENGIGWSDVGPAAGYFPFRIGLLIVMLGLAIAAHYAIAGRMRRPAETAAAALIPWLGLYFASVLFLVLSMMTLGTIALWKALPIAAGTMAAFYVIFEFWFQVPLEKGVVMPLLGIY